MNKKILLLFLIIIIVLSGATFAFFWNKNEGGNNEMILFYRIGCPYCEKVEEFLKENNVESKIKFEKKDVGLNRDNANLLLQKAKICGLRENEIGVPFLWDGSKCIMGDVDIINFFKQKIS